MKTVVVYAGSEKPYSVALTGCGNQKFLKAGDYPVLDKLATYLVSNKPDLFKLKAAPKVVKAPEPVKEKEPAKVEEEAAKPKPKPKPKPRAKKED